MKKIVSKITSVVLSAALLVTSSQFSFQVNAEYSRVWVHDPSIVKTGDNEYYIIGTHLAMAKTNDLMNWSFIEKGDQGGRNSILFDDIDQALATPIKWSGTSENYDIGGMLWAPDIVWNKSMNKWCMYASINGDYWHSCIAMCTADNIEGPYTYAGIVVYSGFETNPLDNENLYTKSDVQKVLGNNPDLSRYLDSNGRWNADYGTNAIDPCTFYDENGNLWMIYGSWFGGIYMLELDEATGLRDYSVTYSTQENVSDAYMGKKIAGGHYASGEGPYIEYMRFPGTNKGYYYLFISNGYFNNNGGYNMRIYRSETPDGPYYDQNGNSPICKVGTDNIGGTVGERLMSNYQWSCNAQPYKAQGHNSALMDDDGKQYVIYHTKFDDSNGFHAVRVHQMFLNEDGWPVAAPYEYSGETISDKGYTETAVVGDYEFIFHTLNQKFVNEKSADVETPKNITLHANGTVTGDLSGTWTMKNGTPYMSFVYDGVTYKGVFLLQGDESDTKIWKITFTATGNNTCVWGSKKSAYVMTDDMVDRTSDSKLVYKADSSAEPVSTLKIGNTNLLSGVSYQITNTFNGKALDLTDGKTTENNSVQQWALTGGKQQEWRITATADGYCKIASMADESMVLAVNGTDGSDGLDIVVQKYTGADNQQWKLSAKLGSYGLCSKVSGGKSAVDVFGWSTENGGELKQWNYWGGDCQTWNIKPSYPKVNDGTYTIKNLNSSLWMSSASNSAIQSDSASVWTIEQLDNGNYTIRSSNGKALTVQDGKSADGQNIALADYTGDTSQQFGMFANGDGSYAIMTASSDFKSSLDVLGISTESGASIVQWSYWGGGGQNFILEPAANIRIQGDLNADGLFNIADVVLLQKWLLAVPNTTLADWKAGDVCEDGALNTFDLCFLKRMLLES